MRSRSRSMRLETRIIVVAGSVVVVMAFLRLGSSSYPRRVARRTSQVAGARKQRHQSPKEKVQIAEFVPEVAFEQGFAVSELEVRAAGDRFEHREVAGTRLVEASEQRIDSAD